jgi:hypothetical protein
MTCKIQEFKADDERNFHHLVQIFMLLSMINNDDPSKLSLQKFVSCRVLG